MRLVFVHGRDQQGKDPRRLQKTWETALYRGLRSIGKNLPDDVEIAFPYYGDALDKLVKQVDAPLTTVVLTRGAGADDPQFAFRAAMLFEIARRAGIRDKDIAAFYRGVSREMGLQNADWVLAISRALDRTPLRAKVIDRLTRDVYVYLTYGGVQGQIDEIVAKEICQGPCVVVAHSLGTVVAYRVLKDAPSKPKVRLFETVGSPLALKAIKQKLGYPAMPVCAQRWFNGRDPKDIVALYPLDAKNFHTTPAIVNRSNVKNHTDNHHGIDGYLDDQVVAQEIFNALTKRVG